MSPFLLVERHPGRLKLSEARISFSRQCVLEPKQANFLTRLGGSRCTHALPGEAPISLDSFKAACYSPRVRSRVGKGPPGRHIQRYQDTRRRV